MPVVPSEVHYSQLFYWIALGIVAVVSMIVGPFVQWKIAQRQTKLQADVAGRQVADNIAGRRQAWIDALRSEIAEFLAIAEAVTDLDGHRHSSELNNIEKRALVERQMEQMLRGLLLKATIALRLNNTDLDQVLLGNALDAISDEIEKCDVGKKIDREHVHKLYQPVVDTARIVLKNEWNRIKSGTV